MDDDEDDGCGEKELVNGELGNGRCPSIPPKLSLVGVAGAESSFAGVLIGRDDAILGGRGVVGVVAS